MINFRDWLNAQEDSPIGRAKMAMAFGIGPDLPLAALNSRVTINPLLLQAIMSRKLMHPVDDHEDDKGKKKKHKKKKKD